MKIFSVKELNSQIQTNLRDFFNYPIMIKGELVNASISANGHQFFTLRESLENNQYSINCVLFKNKFKPVNNLTNNLNIKNFEHAEVLITGKVDFYSPYGRCQINVHEITDYGEGVLKKNIDAIKKKLELEGLFLNKKNIPIFPEKIGIITSPDSHALQDVISKLNERYPIAGIEIYPTVVQGKEAVESLIKKIEYANKIRSINVILLIRGGGSLEDLMPFNNEKLARAISSSKIPIVTGIGHKPDITIADYVADSSMETPTAAAVHISPDKNELLQRLIETDERFLLSVNQKINNFKIILKNILTKIFLYNPNNIIKNMSIEYKNNILKLNSIVNKKLNFYIKVNKQTKSAFDKRNKTVNSQILNFSKNIKHSNKRLNLSITKNLNYKKQIVKNFLNELNVCSPKKTLRKGYSIIRDKKGRILKKKSELALISEFSAEFKDGLIYIEKK